MRVKWIELQNYKSYWRKTRVDFSPGINLFIGKNNVGKSALFEAIACRLGDHPHKGLAAQPHPQDPVDPWCTATVCLEFSGIELRRALLQNRTPAMFVWPTQLAPEPNNMDRAVEQILSTPTLEAAATFAKSAGGSDWRQWGSPGLRGYAIRDATESPLKNCVTVRANDNLSAFEGQQVQMADARNDVGLPAVQLLWPRVYVFEAERRAAGSCRFGRNKVLAANASNLAEVLMNLQFNPSKFVEYQELVRQVFPEIAGITVSHAPAADMVEVRVWLAPMASRRDDLTLSLEECGTGISQVLAILYVVTNSDDRSVVAIDEPNSFLHPEASRAVIQILKANLEHQYIIATHSPEVIAEAAHARISVLEHCDEQTSVTQYEGGAVAQAQAALRAIGARLSDVFGYDKVLWTEGSSDAAVFEMLVRRWNPVGHTIAVRPVRSTADFDKQSIDQALEIYTKLCHGEAFVPLALGFIFDREQRSEKTIEDAERRKDAQVRFLERTMLENYFLHAATLSAFVKRLGTNASLEDVSNWLRQKSGGDMRKWLRTCHGKEVMQEFLVQFTSCTQIYRQALHLPMLAEIQLEIAPDELRDLRALLARMGVAPGA